jgi:hypothetical protein
MIQVLSTKLMPDNPDKSDRNCNRGGKWFNRVRYDVIDWRTKKILLTHSDVCYSGMCGKVASLVGGSEEVELPSNLVIRYYCKDGHNKLRFKFLVYISKMFNRYFKKIKIWWSKGHKEIIVDVWCKDSTPVEVTFMFGQFLRLSWEQFHEWKLDSKSYLFNHLYEALGDNYNIHIPSLLVLTETKGKQFSDKDRKFIVALMLKQIKQGKVFSKGTELSNYTGKGSQYIAPYIQQKVTLSVIESSEYKKRKLPLIVPCRW